MPTTAKFENLIEYTVLAATTAKTIAETTKVPFLGSTAALCLSITKYIELHSISEIKGVLPTALLYDIAKFTEALEKLFTILNGQQRGALRKIKGLFRQPEAGERLEACKQELSRMVELFKAQVTGSTLSQMGQMKKDAKEQHEQLVALLETDSDLTNSDRSSDVVNILIQDSAHIAILGAGGMGKTSLAATALHTQQVEAKYPHRYFVPCHLIPTCTELAATIADHIGLEKGSNMPKRLHITLPTLLLPLWSLTILRPVGSPWHLAPKLKSLMATLRGAECPGKVKWTRPFLAPLEPLSYVAARQTFIEVADSDHNDSSIQELLELTGNLPLAVSLIASVADSEGCSQALSRWKLESTQMLSNGYDQRSSLDISIMLSYTSSRMTLGAQQLLSILSMLPDGLADADLVQAKLPIGNILACKATLIQTALAFVSQDQHLKVLVPIQEHILHTHPPANPLKLKLREHFHQILDLWNRFKNLNVTDIHPQIAQDLGNFNTVLHEGLEPEGPDIVQNVQSILFLTQFYERVHNTYSPLLLQLSGKMLHNPLLGEYLIQLLHSSKYLPDLDVNGDMTRSTQHFKSKAPLEQARWYRALGTYFSEAKSDFVGTLNYFQRAYSLAENIGYPMIVSTNALHGICQVLILTGKPLSALMHVKEAYRCTQHMGDIYGQAWSLYLQARCHLMLANYQHVRHLLQNSRDMLTACGQQQGALWLTILNLALLCAERLGDLSTGMNSISATLRWGGVFLSLALKCKEKFLLAEGDDETALSLFNVALDGFTFMDVHRWRADCMVRIADILNSCGEVIKAVGLWKTARPLFERSSQMKDIIKLDAKLAVVDSAVLVKYEAKLQHLADLCVPCIAPEEKYVVEDEEEEEDKLFSLLFILFNFSTVFGQIHTHLFLLLPHLNQFAKAQSCRGMKPGSGVGGSTTLCPVLWQEKRQSGSEAMLHGGSVSSTNAFSFINVKGKVGIPRLPSPTH
ncbi:hypothetical protein C8J57DRAFT_1673528 [Mycena rebaudengoi]|nr:hypothetical protein C8J57DRAFT_1673528 [Mycena rebaudengoi]